MRLDGVEQFLKGVQKVNRPYSGNESYIFISYAHKDSNEVMPIIDELQKHNYRVWYDEGIDPGTEWDKNIATHIEKCGYFIAFISENYINSSNCKDELNFARDLEKKRFLVYLEDIDLPSEMKMRLNRIQNIHKYMYNRIEDFYEKLFIADKLSEHKNININENEISTARTDNEHDLKRVSDGFVVENDVLVKYTGDLEKVVIPDGVTIVGNHAFNCYKDLISVTIPNSVEAIREYAFKDCENLASVTIPGNVKSIDDNAFVGCNSLKSVTISYGVMSIGDYAFADCFNLASVIIPESVTNISPYAFSDYTEIIRKGSDDKPIAHLATGLDDIQLTEIYPQQFSDPVILSIGNNKKLAFEFVECYDEYYTIVSRKKSQAEVVFTIFRKLDKTTSPPVAIFEGKKIKKIYYNFIERHKLEYHFADKEQMQPKIQVPKINHNKNGGAQKKKHFTAQTLSYLYKNALNIPEKFEIPDKYQIIDAKILAMLAKNFEVKVNEIIIPGSVEKILDYAFTGFKIKNTITIPDSVTSIGTEAFLLSGNAYVICSENSNAYKYCKEVGLRNLPDIKKERTSKKVCQYCGGKFSGIFKKKCSICGKEKDY